MKIWKKLAAVCAVAFAASALSAAETLSRAEWLALVGDCAQNPQTLKATMGKLSAADQLAFVGEVNAAIAALPGSDEAKSAQFYAANRAAVSGAGKENLAAVLGEVYATVPVEYLTDINERFASELFNRSSETARAMTDEQFLVLSTNALAVINQRCENAENGTVRETFAALMFLRASGGSPAGLADAYVAQMPESQREAASAWIADALGGDGKSPSYDSLLGAAGAGDEPDHAIVTELAGPAQIGTAMLADLQTVSPSSGAPSGGGAFTAPSIAGAALVDMEGSGLDRVPRAYVSSAEAVGGDADGKAEGENPYYTHSRGSTPGSDGGFEPLPYPGQDF